MNRLAVLLLALAATLPCYAQTGEAAPQGVAAELSADTVPVYVWGIVALLGVAWLMAILPDRRPKPRTPVVPDLLPGIDLPPAPPASAPKPRPQAAAARPQPIPPAPRVAPSAPPQPAAARPLAPNRPAAWSLEAIRDLDGKRFENFVQGLWQVNGYKADLSGKSADGGAEIRIHSAGGGRLFAVAQCRPARSGPLGGEAVGGLWDAVQQHAAALGIFYGLAGFAPEALAFAQGKRLKLLNAAELLAQVSALRPEQQKALLEHVWRQG